uniref:Uncharacterized protein n=1 Tax=Romanomermis culicivorax TaxID=13658 RepID=A0A915HGA1_ROMCU
MNEFNIQNPEKPEEFEFTELKLVYSSANKCLSANGLGPPLENYYLLLLQPIKSFPLNAIVVMHII